ncbi:MAG: CBS domain-containing protein, partial [Acidobacteriota bacterium]|nr:CBS domain-containing protein [Acidobacteriota bacterium]
GRGFALWLLLLSAVVVRELARAVAHAWCGLEVRSLLLLPSGGLVTFATPEVTEQAGAPHLQKRLAMVGPAANLLVGLLLVALTLTIAPQINVMERPWITPSHLLRAAIWVNLLLGVINLLPAAPLDGGRVFRGEFARARGGVKGLRAAAGLSQMISLALLVAGILLPNMWLIVMGIVVMFGGRLEDQGVLLQEDADAVRMRDIMLVDFSTLSASDTLEDALQRSIHSLQDVFPVVRGGNLVGAVSRQSIVQALQTQGNGYIQGIMARSFQTAEPGDSLIKTLRRISNSAATQLVPVVENGRILGIITPQNLSQSMAMLNQRRRLRERSADEDNER